MTESEKEAFDEVNLECMRHQTGQTYNVGYEHGARVAFAKALERAARLADEFDRLDKDGQFRSFAGLRNAIRALTPDTSLVVVERPQLEEIRKCLRFEKGRVHDLYAADAKLEAMLKGGG